MASLIASPRRFSPPVSWTKAATLRPVAGVAAPNDTVPRTTSAAAVPSVLGDDEPDFPDLARGLCFLAGILALLLLLAWRGLIWLRWLRLPGGPFRRIEALLPVPMQILGVLLLPVGHVADVLSRPL